MYYLKKNDTIEFNLALTFFYV